MGSRGRSIRLRIYFLVAIPLVTMLGLFGYVAYASITNFINLDRAPNLIRATSVPLGNFLTLLQNERRAAVVYAAAPTVADKAQYNAAINATLGGFPTLETALNSSATKGAANAQETAKIGTFLTDVSGLTAVRQQVLNGQLTPLTTLTGYANVILDVPRVFQAEAGSLSDPTAATEALGLVETVTDGEEMQLQDAILSGALAAGNLTAGERVAFAQSAGREQNDVQLYTATLSPTELAAYNAVNNGMAPAAVQTQVSQVQQGVEAGLPLTALESQGLTFATWTKAAGALNNANFDGSLAAASAELTADQALANNAHNRVYITGAVGLLGLILTLIVTIFLARSINRRLTRLRRSALTLAEEHLPSVVARLRRGETVDVDAEAAPLRIGNDEIGQVGQAFDAVRLTAIASAVEEARLRQGVNDVFRNLARRNQSLLQRQLTSLDQMERKATDPEVLDDLFKLDHLTTRMRRHAEGLIILSGAPPGRGWSAPVRLIDVMRGAVSEVEDYARVQVATQSKVALSGSAVTDVIHLLAELIENATSLSPPYTQVRVSGEPVTNGFAIEIEDRGLGMTPQRLAELNDRLANPPDVNPANTEQLGLFVVAQLARRHGIQVTLRASPYGGTSAVVLIPRHLVVEDAPAALTSGENPMLTGRGGKGAQAALPSFSPSGTDGGYSLGSGTGLGGGNGAGRRGTGDFAAPRPGGYGPGAPAGSPPDLDSIPVSDYGQRANGSGAYQTGSYQTGSYQSGSYPAGSSRSGGYPQQGAPAGGSRSGGYPQQGAPAGGSRSSGYPQQGTPGTGSQRGRHSDEVPVVTGVPVSRDIAPPFDVFNPISRPDGDAAESHVADGTGYPPSGGSPDFANGPYQAAGYGTIDGDGNGRGNGDADAGEHAGLPRRVRQANLAPQLRAQAASGTSPAGPGTSVPQATAASLTDMRDTLSAMQRGWQQGRSQSVQRDTEGNSHGA